MSEAVVDADVIKDAVELACRAPSLHNSQPWRWVAQGGGVLHLFADRSRIGHHTDSTGREVIISCGAVLDHLRVAMAAGWEAIIGRYPNPNDRDHLASIEFREMAFVSDVQRALAEAIRRRRTDRLPFAAPTRWESFETVLRTVVDKSVADLDVIDDDGRPALADASRLTEQVRQHDSSYEAELLWWTGYSFSEEGIPPSAQVSETEAQRVDVARSFPTSGQKSDRRADLDRDDSKIVVLSTYDDSRGNALRCGEVLSMVLLECTQAALATCTLTHMIEVNASREFVRRLTGRTAEPQVLIRVGQAPKTDPPPPPTPRRALTNVLEIR